MTTDFNFWTIAFIVSFSFMLGAIVIAWVALREFWQNKSIKALLFGLGFLAIAGANLNIALSNPKVIPQITIAAYVIGFGLIFLSLVKNKWNYLFVLGGLIPLFLPLDSPYFVTVMILAVPIVVLARTNFCTIFCTKQFCKGDKLNKREGREWSLVFAFIILSVGFYILAKNLQVGQIKIYLQAIGVLFEALSASVVYYHILKCVNFSRRDRLIMPVIICIIAVIMVVGYLSNSFISNYMENILKPSIQEDVSSAKYIAELTFPGGLLSKKMESRDMGLNDLADRIYARTGSRITFFWGNERVAATPSATGGGRLLGTKIEDPSVLKAVLTDGSSYVGRIEKNGQIVLAAYVPVYKNDKIVGMIGTGRLISEVYGLQDKLLVRLAAGVAVVMAVAFGIVGYALPKKAKSLQ